MDAPEVTHPYQNTTRKTWKPAPGLVVQATESSNRPTDGDVELSDRGLTVLRFRHPNALAAGSELAITINRAHHQPVERPPGESDSTSKVHLPGVPASLPDEAQGA